MRVYQLNDDNLFVGPVIADESPLEPGVFHIPAGCVLKEPPSFAVGKQARWDEKKDKWIIENTAKKKQEEALAQIEAMAPVDKLKKFLLENPDVVALMAPATNPEGNV